MMKKFFTILSVGLVSAASASVGATSPASSRFEMVDTSDVIVGDSGKTSSTWSFEDCLAYGITHSTDVREAILSILQADENIGEAKDAWLPIVDFNTSHSFQNYPSPSVGVKGNAYNSSYGVDATWTVWEGNVRKYRLESARLFRNQQVLAGDAVVKDMTLAILQAYLNILYAREAVDIANLTLQVSEAQAARTKRLMESGRSSRVDYAQIESQAAQDKYAVVQAESNLATACLEMKKILNLGLDTPFDAEQLEFKDSDIDALLPDRNRVYDLAVAWLPEFASNQLSKEIYANDVNIAKASRLPQVALQGGVGTGYTTGGSSWTSQMGHGFNERLGVSLSVPIYDANSSKRAVTKAKLASLEYDINQDKLSDQLSHTIESLYIDAESARAKYKAGTIRLESALLTADLVDRQFELGLVNPLELLTAHNDLLTARLEQLQNKFMAILANKTIEFYATGNVAMTH